MVAPDSELSPKPDHQRRLELHYYQFNIGDYAKSTKYLTDLQDLAYRRLLDICYDSEKPLPKTVEEVAELIGFLKNPSEVDQVLKKYFKLTKNGFIQKRVQKELGVYQSKAATARVNGKKGGRPKNNPEITQSVNLANPEETQSKAKQEPITNNHKPIIKDLDQSEIDQCFERFWLSGIRKVNKKKSKSLFSNILKKTKDQGWSELTEILTEDVKLRIDSNQLGFSEMHPTTYLNGERWKDDIINNHNQGERSYTLDELGKDFING